MTQGISDDDAVTLKRDAQRMKQQPDVRDSEAIKRLVADVLSPGSIAAD